MRRPLTLCYRVSKYGRKVRGEPRYWKPQALQTLLRGAPIGLRVPSKKHGAYARRWHLSISSMCKYICNYLCMYKSHTKCTMRYSTMRYSIMLCLLLATPCVAPSHVWRATSKFLNEPFSRITWPFATFMAIIFTTVGKLRSCMLH